MSDTNDPAPAGEASGLLGEVGRLTDRPSIRRVITYALAAKSAWETYQALRKWWIQRSTYKLTIRGGDPIYDDLQAWMLKQVGANDRHLEVRTVDKGRAWRDDPIPVGAQTAGEVKGFFARGSRFFVTVDGHRVEAFIQQEAKSAEERMNSFSSRYEEVNFTCQSRAARDSVLALFSDLAGKRAVTLRPPNFMVATSWGDWHARNEMPRRDLESVVLDHGQMTDIVNDLLRFIDSEDLHNRLGMPWHRGYLLHGPPGMGKTSLVKALANHFGLDLYYISLNDLDKDTKLIDLVSRVAPRSILLLEDVDVYSTATSRDDDHVGHSLSGLLNALDGVSTPHGLITILTTNDPEVLDPALVRTGRIDRQFKIGPTTGAQVKEIMRRFVGEVPLIDDGPLDIPVSDFIEIIKQHDGESSAAVAVEDLLACQRLAS